MKRIFLLSLLTTFSLWTTAQNKIVQWSSSYNAQNAEVVLTATMQDGWHIYSQMVDENAGPVATSFEFSENKAVTLIGKVNEPTPISEYDANFEATVLYFDKKVDFTQKIKTTSPTELGVSVVYMVCNNVMCLPPVEHKMTLKITQ